jgi:hypothetical protein
MLQLIVTLVIRARANLRLTAALVQNRSAFVLSGLLPPSDHVDEGLVVCKMDSTRARALFDVTRAAHISCISIHRSRPRHATACRRHCRIRIAVKSTAYHRLSTEESVPLHLASCVSFDEAAGGSGKFFMNSRDAGCHNSAISVIIAELADGRHLHRFERDRSRLSFRTLKVQATQVRKNITHDALDLEGKEMRLVAAACMRDDHSEHLGTPIGYALSR